MTTALAPTPSSPVAAVRRPGMPVSTVPDGVAPWCEHQRRGTPACGSVDGLVRLFVGWRCRAHTLPGAQVYDVAPHLQSGALLGPGLVVAADGTLRAPGADRDPAGQLAPVDDRPLAPVHQLPDPARRAAAVHAGATGAEAQAAVLVAGRTGTPRRRLLERAVELGEQGLTSTEAHRWYEATHGRIDLYSLRPRLTELKRDGWLVDAGKVRHPRGAPAEEVLVLSDRGRGQLAAEAAAGRPGGAR